MEEKRKIKISLGTVICIFIIFILVLVLLGMYLYYNNIVAINTNTNANNENTNINTNNITNTYSIDNTNSLEENTNIGNLSFILEKSQDVPSLKFTYPTNWKLEKATDEQHQGFRAKLTSPSGTLTILMANSIEYIDHAGMGAERSLEGEDIGKIIYYEIDKIKGFSGYNLYTAVTEYNNQRIYDSAVGLEEIDAYYNDYIEHVEPFKALISGLGIKGNIANTQDSSGDTVNLYIKIIINELGIQNATSSQYTKLSLQEIKEIINTDEYNQARSIIKTLEKQ